MRKVPIVTGKLKPLANRRNIVGKQLPKLLGVVASVRSHVAKSLTGFKLCPTTPNNKQQGVQTDAHVTSNNVGSCWPTTLCLFAWGFTIQATCDTA